MNIERDSDEGEYGWVIIYTDVRTLNYRRLLISYRFCIVISSKVSYMQHIAATLF